MKSFSRTCLDAAQKKTKQRPLAGDNPTCLVCFGDCSKCCTKKTKQLPLAGDNPTCPVCFGDCSTVALNTSSYFPSNNYYAFCLIITSECEFLIYPNLHGATKQGPLWRLP